MIPPDLRAVILERRKAERHARLSPTLADLTQDGPDLSPRAFARIIGMSQSWVRQLCADGFLKARKVGTHWRIDRAFARRWITDFLKPAA